MHRIQMHLPHKHHQISSKQETAADFFQTAGAGAKERAFKREAVPLSQIAPEDNTRAAGLVRLHVEGALIVLEEMRQSVAHQHRK